MSDLNRSETNFTIEWKKISADCPNPELTTLGADGIPNWNSNFSDSNTFCTITNVSYALSCCMALGEMAATNCNWGVCLLYNPPEDKWAECAARLARQLNDSTTPSAKCVDGTIMRIRVNKARNHSTRRATLVPIAIVVLLAAAATLA